MLPLSTAYEIECWKNMHRMDISTMEMELRKSRLFLTNLARYLENAVMKTHSEKGAIISNNALSVLI
jgi:hypothetical protein